MLSHVKAIFLNVNLSLLPYGTRRKVGTLGKDVASLLTLLGNVNRVMGSLLQVSCVDISNCWVLHFDVGLVKEALKGCLL